MAACGGPAMIAVDARALSAWGALVLQLHRGSRQWPAERFQPRAAELLLALLPADGLWWGAAAAEGDLAPAADPATPAEVRAGPQPRLGHGLWLGLYRVGDWPPAPEAACMAEPRVQACCTEPLTGARWLLALRRAPGAAPFAAADQAALDLLLPHLVEAWRECTLQALAAPPPGARAVVAAPGHALAGTDGRLHLADERFIALLRLEWPWAGSQRLPEALAVAVARLGCSGPPDAPDPVAWQGRRLSAQLQARPDGAVQLVLRPRSALDSLSPRRRDIVQRYAAGLTGPQIAAELGLSASTVNNQLGAIFKQLGIRTKLQLRTLVDGQGG